MPMDGVAWAGWGEGLREYMQADAPLELVPVGGGDNLPFVHDSRNAGKMMIEGGMLEGDFLWVATAVDVVMGSQWTYDGKTWTVIETEDDTTGVGGDFPYLIQLKAHVT